MQSRPIGEIIRTLRHAQGYTQEELAELLAVSGQAVSKWENGMSMPDISMIVPLASVFGVSTDVLFDTATHSDEEAVSTILREAESLVRDENGKATKDGLYASYTLAREGLRRYPAAMPLHMYALERGIALAYPENDCHDPTRGPDIYRDCIRMADIVIAHSRQTTDVLRAHMIMVLLHAAYGNTDRAREHAAHFPWRADMTVHEMSAYIAHADRRYAEESLHCQRDTMYHLEALLDDITQNGCALMAMSNYPSAATCFETVASLISTVFSQERDLPPLHFRERGDTRLLLAEAYLGMGDSDRALAALRSAVDFELAIRPRFRNDQPVTTPLLRDIGYSFYYAYRTRKGYLEALRTALSEPRFTPLHDRDAFTALTAALETACAEA